LFTAEIAETAEILLSIHLSQLRHSGFGSVTLTAILAGYLIAFCGGLQSVFPLRDLGALCGESFLPLNVYYLWNTTLWSRWTFRSAT